MSKYVKVMFGTTSGAKSDFEYKLNEVNISNNWNPEATNGKDFGGFNYADEKCILRWLHRGDVVYDVEIPNDAENIKIEGATTIYRTNKIIIKNPRKMTDEMALDFYKKSNIPELAYYKALGVVALMNYQNTALQIFRDKVNTNNIDEVLEEWNDFIYHGGKDDRNDCNETVILISKLLNEVKSKLSITLCIEKEPYIKTITNDKIINITGESGSGKSYYARQYKDNNEYIILDTDTLFSNQDTEDTNIIDLRKIFITTFNDDLKNILIPHFDECYKIILNYFKLF